LKLEKCAACGKGAKIVHKDTSHGAAYGVECEEGHWIGSVFGTKNRAAEAWNECQSFMRRYAEGVDNG